MVVAKQATCLLFVVRSPRLIALKILTASYLHELSVTPNQYILVLILTQTMSFSLRALLCHYCKWRLQSTMHYFA